VQCTSAIWGSIDYIFYLCGGMGVVESTENITIGADDFSFEDHAGDGEQDVRLCKVGGEGKLECLLLADHIDLLVLIRLVLQLRQIALILQSPLPVLSPVGYHIDRPLQAGLRLIVLHPLLLPELIPPRHLQPPLSRYELLHEGQVEAVDERAVEGVEEGGEDVVLICANAVVPGEGLDVIELEVFEDIFGDGLIGTAVRDTLVGKGEEL
jgi:hypothetical protein